jgi:hypothetical protein
MRRTNTGASNQSTRILGSAVQPMTLDSSPRVSWRIIRWREGSRGTRQPRARERRFVQWPAGEEKPAKDETGSASTTGGSSASPRTPFPRIYAHSAPRRTTLTEPSAWSSLEPSTYTPNGEGGSVDEGKRERTWTRIRLYFRQLALDMERNSVSAQGSSPTSCCHVPVEDLERRSAMYREIAREKAAAKQTRRNG